MQSEKSGILWVTGAFLFWGIMPIYWKHLEHVQSDEILTGRIVWAFISTVAAVLIMKNGRKLLDDIQELWKTQTQFWSLFIATVLISGNWFTYIWAVNNDYIVQTSLG